MRLLRKNLKGTASEWIRLCCMSDLHFGSSYCDKIKLKRYLEEAKERNARILIIGDVFDLLLPKDRKRFQVSVLEDYYKKRDDIINAVIDKCVELLEPYADLIDLISLGNHEADLIKWHSIDPIVLLIGRLNQMLKEKGSKHKIQHGGYRGYFQYVVNLRTENSSVFNIFYFHGKGGESAVTKGMIDIHRVKTNFVYDLHVFGHKHHLIADADINVIPSSRGKVNYRESRALQCGTFMKTYRNDDVSNVSFAERQGFAPKPVAAGFAKFRWTGHQTSELQVRVEI